MLKNLKLNFNFLKLIDFEIAKILLKKFIVKLYDSQKEKNAKTAAFVSLIVVVLWQIFVQVLSFPDIELLLSEKSIFWIKTIVDILAVGKLIITGARTTKDLSELKGEDILPIEDKEKEESLPLSQINDINNKGAVSILNPTVHI